MIKFASFTYFINQYQSPKFITIEDFQILKVSQLDWKWHIMIILFIMKLFEVLKETEDVILSELVQLFSEEM